MKKILYAYLTIFLSIGFFACSEDDLVTAPTGSVELNEMLQDADGAQAAMEGVYRMLFTSGWSVGNEHQNFGIMSTKMFTSLMGEDFLQDAQGNGWFYFDYGYAVRDRYTSAAWRSYATWNFYYTLISNANYILDAEETLEGDPKDIDNVMAQAYTIRAYSYFQLIQLFQQTYVGNQNAPGVPVYTEGTTNKSVGKSRGTVEEVYTQINSDLNDALEKFEASGKRQAHPSHIDIYIASAIKANVALVQNKWDLAAEYAKKALSKKGLSLTSGDDLFTGFNNRNMKGVLWASEVIADQSGIYASFFAHMDARADRYARSSRKCIYNWLYNQIDDKDIRKQWWNGPQEGEGNAGKPYNQHKFQYSSIETDLGDYIYMRADEMQLVLAEALCHDGKYTEAKDALMKLLKLRYNDDYDLNQHPVHNAEMSNENRMRSIGQAETLMDHILLQRRIELWGEAERIFDIQRLKMGFDRNASDSNHSRINVGFDTTVPGSKEFILTIPQKEFDGNPNMGPEDQNPM